MSFLPTHMKQNFPDEKKHLMVRKYKRKYFLQINIQIYVHKGIVILATSVIL